MNAIRLVARQAQAQGVQHRASKFAIHIGEERYDEKNLKELPPQLSLSSIKTLKIDDNTLAYQSEHSIYSNLAPAKIKIGKHDYTKRTIISEQSHTKNSLQPHAYC